jgi:hypothetical protein
MAKGKWPESIDCPRTETSRLKKAGTIISDPIKDHRTETFHSDPFYQNEAQYSGFVELMQSANDDKLLEIQIADYGENEAAIYCGFLEVIESRLSVEHQRIRQIAENNKALTNLIDFELERRKRQREYDPGKLPPVVGAYVCGNYGSTDFKIPLRRKSSGANVISSWPVPHAEVPTAYEGWLRNKLIEAKAMESSDYSIPRSSAVCRITLENGFPLSKTGIYVIYPQSYRRRFVPYDDLVLRQEYK